MEWQKKSANASNVETLYLIASYVFDEIDYGRMEWRYSAVDGEDVTHVRSKAEQFGFTYEGVWRRKGDGGSDVYFYSIVADSEGRAE